VRRVSLITDLDNAARFVRVVRLEDGEPRARIEHVEKAERDALVQGAHGGLVLPDRCAVLVPPEWQDYVEKNAAYFRRD
jgi:hypothetical protein